MQVSASYHPRILRFCWEGRQTLLSPTHCYCSGTAFPWLLENQLWSVISGSLTQFSKKRSFKNALAKRKMSLYFRNLYFAMITKYIFRYKINFVQNFNFCINITKMTKKTGMENRKQLLIFNIPTRTFVGESLRITRVDGTGH